MRAGAVILAAGAGQRFGAGRPKQFQRLGNEPLFMRPLRSFARAPSVKHIVLVGAAPFLPFLRRWARRIASATPIVIERGGDFRGESVRNGVRALAPDVDVILIHDAARALVSRPVIDRVARAAYDHGVAVAGWPLPDTLKEVGLSNRVRRTIPRRSLWLAQTPQGFRRSVALECLLRPSMTATDDVELAERRGHRVSVVRGAPENFKVTYPYDLDVCRRLIR
jgi:2-C-methyl-D-erythritol 4-phosphate cytidylyltransferase